MTVGGSIFLVAVGLYAVSSGVPGTRRVVLAVVVLALAAAVGADVLGRWLAVEGPRLGAVVPLVVLVALAVPLTPEELTLAAIRGDLDPESDPQRRTA